jgi:hypothetical protein
VVLEDARRLSCLEVDVVCLLELSVVEDWEPFATEELQALAGLWLEEVEVLLIEVGEVDGLVGQHDKLPGPMRQSIGHLSQIGRQLTPPQVCPIIGWVLAFQPSRHPLCLEEL